MSSLEISFVLKDYSKVAFVEADKATRKNVDMLRRALLAGPYIFVDVTKESLRVAFRTAMSGGDWKKLKAVIKKSCGGKKSGNNFKLKPRKRMFVYDGR